MGEASTDPPLMVAAARTMLGIFASVGAARFHVTWTNSAGRPRRPSSLRKNLQSLGGPLPQTDNADWLNAVHIAPINVADLGRTISALLDTAIADRLNLTVRPRGRGVRFIQLDDLAADKLPALASAMFLDAGRVRPEIRAMGKARCRSRYHRQRRYRDRRQPYVTSRAPVKTVTGRRDNVDIQPPSSRFVRPRPRVPLHTGGRRDMPACGYVVCWACGDAGASEAGAK